jgi:hypothetical protein
MAVSGPGSRLEPEFWTEIHSVTHIGGRPKPWQLLYGRP